MGRNYKITTWNVNGLRSALRNGIWEWVQIYSPDVLCLQEIRTSPAQLTEEQHEALKSYQVLWNPGTRKGYSGVATFNKEASDQYYLGMGDDEFDNEGRVIWSKQHNLDLYNVYFPNGGRDHGRVPYKLEFYARLLKKSLERREMGASIILCGDFNTAHQEIDLFYPKQNVNTTGFLPEEREWIDNYLNQGFVDIYRMLYPERVQYTWWTYRYGAREKNIGWRLDYFLISEELATRVVDVEIHEDILGSDHCPVSLILEI